MSENSEENKAMPVRVLLVEDDQSTRGLYKTTLEKAGFQVVEAENYDQAIALTDDSIRVALLDVVLAEDSGLDVLIYIQKYFPFCSNIMISAHADKNNAIAALQQGAVDFLEKPVDRQKLVKVVSNWSEVSSLKQENVRLQDYQAMYQAVQEREDTLSKYKLLFDNISDLAYICDDKGKILFANNMLETIAGHKPEEMIGKPFAPLFDEQNLAKAMDVYQRTLQGESLGFELVFKDTGILCEYNNIPFRDDAGNIIGVMGVARDISERKRAEEALLESEKRYRSFIENFHGIAFRGALNFTPIFFHGAVEEITGYTEKDFIDGNPTWDQVIHADDLPHILKIGEKICSVPDFSDERQYRIVRKDGEVRWIEEYIQNTCDETGHPAYCQGVIHDITERKQADEQIRKLSSAVEQSPASIIITDVKGTIEYVNQSFSRISGYSREEAIGNNPNMLQSGNTPAAVYADMWPTILAGRIWQGEVCNKRKDGSLYWDAVSISSLKNAGGENTHFVAVQTASEMYAAVTKNCKKYSAIIKSAAVSDYRPAKLHPDKIKKGAKKLELELVANKDILKELGRRKKKSKQFPTLVGFAAESQAHLQEGQKKLKSKNLDFIVINDILGANTGFASDTNQVTILDRNGSREELPLLSKNDTAHRILDRIAKF